MTYLEHESDPTTPGSVGAMDHRDELIEIEQRFWRAAGDRVSYERNLSDDAIHILPGWGIADRDAVLAGVAEADPWQRFEIENPKVVPLCDGGAALVYEAHAARAGESSYDAAITSVYRRRGATWELTLHQQTPLFRP
jgi:hypothetical protein